MTSIPLAVEMRGVTKVFPGVVANDSVDLNIHAGEIHALLGENGAGKSTLMNILAGLYQPDGGEVWLHGEPAVIRSPSDAIRLGVGMVHQHFKLVQPQTVAENVILGLKEPAFRLDMKRTAREISALGEQYKLTVDPNAYIWQLSVGEQQRVEILKMLYRNADILILDEPTAVLTPQESEELGLTLRRMIEEPAIRGRGGNKAVIFISHKLDEVTRFADRVTVLRGGKVEATLDTPGVSKAELASLMVGRSVIFQIEKPPYVEGVTEETRQEVLFAVHDLHALNDKGLPALDGVTLDIHAGEILGIAGVAGNGQRELAETITGLRNVTSGQVLVRSGGHGGKLVDATNHSPHQIIEDGLSHVPGDRLGIGLVGNLAISDNIILKEYRQAPLSRGPFLNRTSIGLFAERLVKAFHVATPNVERPVRLLSGGNLQKVILAREITASSGLLVAVHPTRGLDVGATESVQRSLLDERAKGAGILLVSEDLDELLSICDRIAVMFEGKVMGILPAENANRNELGLMMAGENVDE
ncbi:MAG: ABC transporter ATP-binding protein [Anaerolineae bacterium]|nr:ABC transporter ATP-binding protein [Anaerolineae bacterium]MCB9133027.1 ABC transporter ATP-binding protein [Anaerolineales bacterium]MCB0234001.1 ABC transporter ATP-binding protein [Anaerolineae bacterium]MCB0241956.1 ABC transporter ATP-binding protein [Anaerolineae bacterium]MCB0250653.1 ABC transporter ATP-binding protein [Anaerolineae bacterium]